MRLDHLDESIRFLLEFLSPPNLLIIHCGGNEIGPRSMVDISYHFKSIVRELKILIPNTTLVFSQILPRLTWRYIESNKVANNIRRRLNSNISTFFIKNGGCYVKYPTIIENPRLFESDDTHLSSMGNDYLLETLSNAIYSFLFENTCIFPS
jgi:hypothetical protein